MPVGRVFNAAQNQVLISPVSAYYEGKRKRANLEQAEADLEYTELRSQELKASMEPDDSEKTRLELEKIRLVVQEKRANIGDAAMQRLANAYGPIFDQATKMSETGDLDGAIAYVNEELPIAAEKLGPEVLAEFLESRGEDQHLDKKEISRAKESIRAYWEMYEADSGESSLFAKINPKDFTSESVAEFQRTEDFSVLRKVEAGTRPSEKEKEIALYRSLGESEEDSIDLAYDNITVTSSTDSMGNVTVTNTRTKKSYKISARAVRAAGLDVPAEDEKIVQEPGYTGPAWAKPVASIQPAQNLTNQNISESQGKLKEIDKALQAAALVTAEDMMDAAGVANIAQRGMNNVLQLISFNTLPRVFQEETDARLKVMFFNQAVRSAVVISSRGNVWEQQMVEKMLPKPDNILADPIGEGIAFSRTIHYLQNQREAEVAFIEGRAAVQIARTALGIKDDPIVVTSEEDAESYPPGTWVILNGRRGQVP